MFCATDVMLCTQNLTTNLDDDVAVGDDDDDDERSR